jgi:hypothetical protein
LAVRILGGEAEACSLLRATAAELRQWLSGEAAPPVETLLRAFDLILEDPALAARHAVLLTAQDKEPL